MSSLKNKIGSKPGSAKTRDILSPKKGRSKEETAKPKDLSPKKKVSKEERARLNDLQPKRKLSKEEKIKRGATLRRQRTSLNRKFDVMKMLTESERNKIKREIGDAFRRVLVQSEVKLILKKQPRYRTEEEIDKLVKFLEGYDYLKREKSLNYSEMRELAQLLTFKEAQTNEEIYKFGDEPQNFYIVLRGTVSLKEKNDVIEHWDWAYSVYEALQKWKREEF